MPVAPRIVNDVAYATTINGGLRTITSNEITSDHIT